MNCQRSLASFISEAFPIQQTSTGRRGEEGKGREERQEVQYIRFKDFGSFQDMASQWVGYLLRYS